MIADRDAWVWVNPKVTIAEIGGTQIFELLPTTVSGLGQAFRQQWRNVPSTVVIGAGEECRPVRAAARRITLHLEKTTVRGKSRKIRVTRAAGLASLPRVTWQGLCRRCEADQQKPSSQHGPCGGNNGSNDTTAQHRQLST